MATSIHEIEHRFLLDGLPEEIKLMRWSHSVVKSKHVYLPGSIIQERFSKRRYYKDLKKERGHTCFNRTVKIGHGLNRLEFKESISQELYQQIKGVGGTRSLKKMRYRVLDQSEEALVWEVDRFLDRDLFLAEVEVPGENYHVTLPSWLEPFVVREVTEELQYEGVALAK